MAHSLLSIGRLIDSFKPVAFVGILALAGCVLDNNAVSPPASDGMTQPNEVNGFSINAGPNVSADEGSVITLEVRVTKPTARSIRKIEWIQVSGDALRGEFQTPNDQTSVQIRLPQVQQNTSLKFVVTVENDLGEMVQDDVVVTVVDRIQNRLPVAVLNGPATAAASNRSVTLNGCGSSDPDGSITQYLWRRTKPNGPQDLDFTTCEINAPLDTPTSSRTAYEFELVVQDNQGAKSAAAILQVIQEASAQNAPPMIQSIEVNPQPTYAGDELILTATASDPEGNTLQYDWVQTQGDTVQTKGKNTAKLQFIAPMKLQTLVFQLTVRDGAESASLSDSRRVEVQVQDRPTYAPYTPQQCLQNPALDGCAAALKFLIPGNPVTPGVGITPPVDSAGACTPDASSSWQHYWGALHEHTAYSDGTALTKPADVFKRVASKGFDFAFSTDHSDNMGLPIPVTLANDPQFCITSPLACAFSDPTDPTSNLMKWSSTAKQAAAASTDAFTAMRGFEWTSDRFGHANVLFSTHYINPKTGPGYLLSMDAFWAWFLTSTSLGGGQDGLMVFNHPGREDTLHGILTQTPIGGDPAYTFNDLAYIPAADYRVVGIEVFGKGDEYDTGGKKGSWLGYALDKGWYLGAAGSEDHHGTQWGEDNLPKTVLIARSRKPQDLREALLARRFYAVAQRFNDVKLEVTAQDSRRQYWMGSRISTADTSVELKIQLLDRPGRNSPVNLSKVQYEILSSQADNTNTYTVYKSVRGGKASITLPVRDRQDWYFIRVRDIATQSIVAVSSPIWIRPGSTPLPSCNPAR